MSTFYDQWFNWMISSSVQTGILILIIAIVLFFGRKFSARFRYTLWGLILLKALLPPFYTTPIGIGQYFYYESAQKAAISSSVGISPELNHEVLVNTKLQFDHDTSEMPASLNMGGLPAIQEDRRQDGGVFWLFCVWFVGVALYFGTVLYYYGWAMGILSRGKTLENGPIDELLQRLGKRLKLRQIPKIVLSDSVRSPFLWGLFKGKIALPANFPGEVSAQEMESVLLHELVHCRRRDMFIARIELLVRGLFWFHPLVQYSLWKLHRERESACDEAVLETGYVSAKQYGDSLLSVLLTTRQNALVPVGFLGFIGFLGILERNTQTHKRLEEIMSQHTKVKRMGIVGWTVILGFILCVLPMAAAQKEEKDETAKESVKMAEKTEEKTIETKNEAILYNGNKPPFSNLLLKQFYIS